MFPEEETGWRALRDNGCTPCTEMKMSSQRKKKRKSLAYGLACVGKTSYLHDLMFVDGH